jgi:DNA-binding NtrC family response regulator
MNIKILIVEDDIDLRDTLSEALQKYSYNADLASGVEEAFFLIKMNNYDIIITDKNMPGKNSAGEGGMQVLKHAKKLLPGAEIIIMTAFANTETVIEAMRLGAFDYILKPFQFDELKEKIDRIIEYRSYSDPEHAISLYRELLNEILQIAQKEYEPSDKELHKIVNSIMKKVESFFKIQKETNRALRNISENVDRLKERIGRENSIYNYIINMRKELDKQLIKIPYQSSKPKE